MLETVKQYTGGSFEQPVDIVDVLENQTTGVLRSNPICVLKVQIGHAVLVGPQLVLIDCDSDFTNPLLIALVVIATPALN